jgi:hypothetical protein
MKTSRATKNSGSILVAAMFFVFVIGVLSLVYLLLVQNSNNMVIRAQTWNSALPVAEAGIEEGMANLNQQGISTSSNAISFSAFSRSLNGGTYSVNSSATGVVSTIISTGIVSAPVTGGNISRTVRVTAQRQGLFSKGMISMTYINLNGNGVISDSYNSLLGAYDPNATPGTNGDIAAVNGLVNLGNHIIDGNLYLGPNSTLTNNPNGGVTGTIYTDWNMPFSDVSLPTTDTNNYTIIWSPAPGTSSSHTFTNSGYYIINDTGDLNVAAGVTVTLDVKVSNYDLSKATISISGGTTNAGTIVMYQESGSLTLGGSAGGGALNNPPSVPSNQPKNFTYFGLPGVTSISLKGSSDFIGVIYAPEADLTLSGGGSKQNLMGSFIAKSLTISGGYNIHYDTSLAGYYYGYYVAGSWQEL